MVGWPEIDPSRELHLQVPADPVLIRVVRLATSGIASMCGFDLDGIEDLKLAVDEVCATLMEMADAAPLTVRISRLDPAGVAIEASTVVSVDARVDDERVALGERILEVTADHHELSLEGGVARFRLVRLGGLLHDAGG